MDNLQERIECIFGIYNSSQTNGGLTSMDIAHTMQLIRDMQARNHQLEQGNATLSEQKDKLVGAIQKTISKNLHLADGDNCTLIDLKTALAELDAVINTIKGKDND